MELKTYRLTIEPLSSFTTPLDSDTIFGHIAWMVAYKEEGSVLQKFLNDFKKNPPFILSSGFPEDKLPVPILKPLTREDKETLLKEFSKSLVEIEDELKEIKNISYIPISDLKNGLIDNLLKLDLVRYLLKNKSPFHIDGDQRIIMRTAVNRFTNSAQEAQLYDHSEVFYNKGVKLDIWIKFFNGEYIGKVEEWFHCLESYGYGANVSSGSGQFRIGSFSEAEGYLPESASPNAFMTISNFTPKGNDPTNGYYNYTVKRGKLGGLWSIVGIDGNSKANVWKSPLVMFQPGSVFKFDREMQRFYGRMVENIYPTNSDVNIMQYALAFPIGVSLKE